MAKNILVIRFSSFGDIAQALTAVHALKEQWPGSTVHWVVREDFAEFLRLSHVPDQVIPYSRRSGLVGLLRLARRLHATPITHIYDAHNNLRSRLLSLALLLHPRFWFVPFIRRPKDRLRRFLQFQLGWAVLPNPSIGALTYLWPLRRWGIHPTFASTSPYRLQRQPENVIGVFPSAAWPLKRWPLEQFKNLILSLPQTRFRVFGGPDDKFCEELKLLAPDRVENWAGKMSLAESCKALEKIAAVVGNDTGLMHVADGMGVPQVMLVGPSAFGYPFNTSSHVVETELWCKPCSKDGRNACKNSEHQKCLKDITAKQVAGKLQEILL
jgi:ADP-heptose:LPS heptosyltransferase